MKQPAKDAPREPIDDHSPNGETRLRAMIEASLDCVITIDAQSTVLEFNAAAEQTFGYRRADVIGKPLTETIIPPSLREGHRMGMAALLKGGISKLLGKRVEMPAMRSDGSEFSVELTVTQIAGQTPPIFTAYIRDITERKRAEAALRQSEERTRLLVKSSNIGLWDWNLITNEVFFSPEWKRQLGCSDVELPNHFEEWKSRLHPEDREQTLRAVQDFHEGRRADYDVEFRLRHKDGSWRWILTRADLTRDAAGQPVRMMGCHIDISARKQAEFALRQLAQVSAASSDYIALIDRDFRYQFVNDAYLKARGLHFDSMIGRHMAEIVGQERFEQLGRPQVEACLRGEEVESFEWTDFRSDFRCFLHVKVSPLRELDGTISGAVMSGRDITGRHEAEEALRESEERFRTIFEQAPLGICEGEIATARFINANQRYVDILGYTIDELRALTFEDYTHPEDLQKDLVEFQKLAAGQIRTFAMEKRYIRKDGAIIWVNLRVSGLARPGEKALNCMAVIEDITERKQAEEELEHSAHLLQILSRRLFQVQEDEKRHLARELHDEMGQALTAAKINLQSAQRVGNRSDLARRLDESIGILDRLLEQTRRLSFDLRPPLLDDLGLVPALRSYLDEQAQRAGFRATFFADPRLERLSPEIETACFRVAQQALTNAVRHAEARTVNVELRLAQHALHLIVRDDGAGFDVEAAEERARRGGSLGLPGMRERLSLVGGELDCKSTPGRGTEVHAFLPLEIDSHVSGLLS